MCVENPLVSALKEVIVMIDAAEASGLPNMVGFNYIRTPASQFVRKLLANGEVGKVTWFRGEHTEDFLADPLTPASWRCSSMSNGTLGDLAPHMINAALALMGPIRSLLCEYETVHKERPGGDVSNDDHAQIKCRIDDGSLGHIYFRCVAYGCKMCYAYEIHGIQC